MPAGSAGSAGGASAAGGQPAQPTKQRDTDAGRRLAKSKGKHPAAAVGTGAGAGAATGGGTAEGEGEAEGASSVEALLQRSGFITRISECCYGIPQGEPAALVAAGLSMADCRGVEGIWDCLPPCLPSCTELAHSHAPQHT